MRLPEMSSSAEQVNGRAVVQRCDLGPAHADTLVDSDVGALADVDRLVGRYRLEHRIGGGGMADVYLATTPHCGGVRRYLALKMVHKNHIQDTEFISALINEARLAKPLTHNNIVQIIDVGHVRGRYFVAMEYVDGVDADALIRRRDGTARRLPCSITAYIAQQICLALHYAHTRVDRQGNPLRIVHRDVSPHNILVGLSGDVKLTDFGIAKANVERTQTAGHIIKGKLEYMSPEHAWGSSVDARADIFGLGVVMYQMLTGQIPLYSDEPGGAIKRLSELQTREIPSTLSLRPDVPRELDDIIMTALHRDRELRYPSAKHMSRDLERFLSNKTPGESRNELAGLLRGLFPGRKPLSNSGATATIVLTPAPDETTREIPSHSMSLVPDIAEAGDPVTDGYDEPPTANERPPNPPVTPPTANPRPASAFPEPPTVVYVRNDERDYPPEREFEEPPTTLMDRNDRDSRELPPMPPLPRAKPRRTTSWTPPEGIPVLLPEDTLEPPASGRAWLWATAASVLVAVAIAITAIG